MPETVKLEETTDEDAVEVESTVVEPGAESEEGESEKAEDAVEQTESAAEEAVCEAAEETGACARGAHQEETVATDELAADAEERKTVVISNPLGEDFSIMRTLPLNGMLNSLATNYNRRNKDVKLYELAKVYVPVEGEDLPDERVQFTLGFYGDGDFFTMKGVVEEFLEKIGMSARPEYDPEAGKTFLHPGRQAEILYKDTVIGYLGEVHPDVADTYGLGERTYIAVLDLPEILPFASFDRKYEGIAKFPAVTRDISMVMPKTVLVGEVEKIIEKRGGKLLEKYNLFDIYEGAQIKEGFKSVAYTISFRAKDRTLEDKDIQPIMEKILEDLSGMGIELRS